MEEEHAEEQDEAPEEEEQQQQQQQAALPHSSSGISAVNGPQPVLRGSPRGSSPRGRSPQGGSPRANSSSNRFQPPEAPELELDPEAGHSLEEALLKQMDMQKKLHEQLEVRLYSAHVWRSSSDSGRAPSECHLLGESGCGKLRRPCVRLSLVCISASMWMLMSGLYGVQAQRQLQVSLEAHGRYISSLIQKESMEGRQLPLQAQEALEAVTKQGGSG